MVSFSFSFEFCFLSVRKYVDFLFISWSMLAFWNMLFIKDKWFMLFILFAVLTGHI